MDRAKALAKRPTKGGPPSDLIALGNKDAKPGGNVRKPTAPLASTVGALPVKRESTAMGGLNKKPKIHTSTFGAALGARPSEVARTASPSTQVYLYEEIAKDIEPHSFIASIYEAEDDEDKLEALLCGAAKYLKLNRARPDPAIFLGLMYLSKSKPSFFSSDTVTEAMCSLLRRDVALNFKAKGNALVSVLVCNMLAAAYQDDENWPDVFVKVYIEDSLGERVWVDRSDCRVFTENIQTAFGTKLPSNALTQEKAPGSANASPAHLGMDDDEERSHDAVLLKAATLDEDTVKLIAPRYTYQQVSLEADIVATLREQLARRSVVDGGSRNILRLLTATAGYPEVRQLAAQRIEMWLQNPKLTKVAQDLLMAVCMNCDQYSAVDIEVMNQICKVRLKMKNLVSQYLLSIRQLLSQHQSNLVTMMTHTVYNELSNSRNPNNMSLLSTMFSHAPQQAAQCLAEIFQDMLFSKDDFLRAVRALLREIVRAVRADMCFPDFALGLMKERNDTKFRDLDQHIKERVLFALTDLICLTSLLSVSPGVREAASALSRGENREVEQLRLFQKSLAVIQRDAVWWLHTVVPKMFKPKPADYVLSLRKVLFAEAESEYYKVDNWPAEGERSSLLNLVQQVPVLEDTLMRVLVIGLSKDHDVSAQVSIELCEQLVRRAATVHAADFPVLKMEREELFEVLFKLSAYKHPENIALPKGYQPPGLAISNLYWKNWIMLLIITAFNPQTFGKEAWEKYPTLRCLMEMTMTNNFRFPPPTMASDDRKVEEIVAKEKQLSELEKQEILQFEGYLAAATSKVTITQANSLLISQLTTLLPKGLARRPPPQVIEQLKWLNSAMQIGQMLCRSREPDFLLDIIHSQSGPGSRSMPWLAELVESAEHSMDVLPVQCLCEFLLHEHVPNTDASGARDADEKRGSGSKQEQLVWRLQGVVRSTESDPRTISEVLDYFLQRLTSTQLANRQLAVKGLSMVLATEDSDDVAMETSASLALEAIPSHRWLLQDLPSIPLFTSIQDQVIAVIRQAVQMETDAASVAAYLVFLSENTDHLQLPQMDDLAFDLATLIVERQTLITHLLPTEASSDLRCHVVLAAMLQLFYTYVIKAQTQAAQQKQEGYTWTNNQDQILLTWDGGDNNATMNILVVHAMVILLTYGNPEIDSKFPHLMMTWFPEDSAPPKAFLVDTSEEALLFPDWLKLKMIRSTNQPLVDVALQDLEPSQLLLFVQSFGIPVWSMCKLLHYLDRSVEEDPEGMEQVVVDKGYMAQLVQVQHMRGATGGEKFQALLTRSEPPSPPDPGPRLIPARREAAGWHMERTPTLPSWQDAAAIRDFLGAIFTQPDATSSSRLRSLRSLQKSITCDPGHLASVITTLKSLLTSEGEAAAFIQGLQRHADLTQPLLRLIMAKANWTDISELFSLLSKHLAGTTSPLTSLVNNTLARRAGQTHAIPTLTSIQQVVESSETPHCEVALKRVVLGAMATSGGRAAAAAETCRLLAEDEEEKTGRGANMSGALVDWYGILDPEVASAAVFARGGRGCQPYLRARLVHQSDWRTLHASIAALLDGDSGDAAQNSRLSVSSVLDFISAILHIPRIWQGRDKKVGRKQPKEHVLKLTPKQILKLVHYILQESTEEVQQAETAAANETEQNPSSSSSWKPTMDGDGGGEARTGVLWKVRMPLLLKCCSYDASLSTATMDHLTGLMAATDTDRLTCVLCSSILNHMYLEVPYLMHQSREVVCTGGDPDDQPATQLDVDTHTILSAFNSAGHGKKAENRMFDANIACRKLASQHPLLLLRQLPLMAAILQHRAQYSWGEVKHRNHLLLYTHILGLLELLQPALFHPMYADSLALMLDSYFDLIRLHGTENKQLASVVSKFVTFLHEFITYDGALAARLMLQHTQTLSLLTAQYPDLSLLRSVLAGLSLPRGNQDDDDDPAATPADPVTPATLPRAPAARPESPWNLKQLEPFMRRIKADANMDDVLDVLRDLDETSKRKVDILQHFLSDLKRLVSSENSTCRNTAHTLIMRHIRHNPSCAPSFVRTYIVCLSHSNEDVVMSALKNLPEMCLLAQDDAELMLQKAFSVGALTRVATETYVTEALQLLNMDTLVG